MSTRGRVQYHQPGRTDAQILIDADGIPGNRIDPEYRWYEVELHDARDPAVAPSFGVDGLCFLEAACCLSRPDQLDVRQGEYEAELVELVGHALDAREVVVFDHTLRAQDAGLRPPSYHAHCDYSAWSADKRMQELLGPERTRAWQRGRYAIVNLWRPLVHPIERAPLGLVRPGSVAASDWVDVEIVFPDRRGQVLGLAYRPEHRWLFLDRMQPHEAALFTVYANAGVRAVPHAAVELLDEPAGARPRQSIESRMFVRLR